MTEIPRAIYYALDALAGNDAAILAAINNLGTKMSDSFTQIQTAVSKFEADVAASQAAQQAMIAQLTAQVQTLQAQIAAGNPDPALVSSILSGLSSADAALADMPTSAGTGSTSSSTSSGTSAPVSSGATSSGMAPVSSGTATTSAADPATPGASVTGGGAQTTT
jgi:hypothetical protein